MDIGNLIARQLRYCRAGSETPEQVAQVEWWREKIAALRAEQPSAEPQASDEQTGAAGEGSGPDAHHAGGAAA